MIETSKIYQFVDEGESFILRFLDAQKLMQDIVLTHSNDQAGAKKFQFFRDLILSSTHLISYLKHRESLGLFIDSESPFFSI